MKSNVSVLPVSKRALVERVRRRLAKQAEYLRATRGLEAVRELGDYYVVDSRNHIVRGFRTIEDLAEFAREEGILAEWEALSEDGGGR